VLPPLPHRPGWQWARVRFQPNGRDLIVQQADVAFPDGPASRLWRLDAAAGTVEGPVVLGSHAARDLVTTKDRTRAFVTSSGDNATWEIDPATLRVLRTHPVGGYAGAVSADGRLFALGSQDGSVRLLDLETGDVRRLHGRLQSGQNVQLTFSADASTLVAADDSGEIVVWDVGRGAIRERFPGPRGEVYGLAVSSDGRTLYSVAPDARMRIWDLAGDRRLDTRFETGPPLIIDNQSPKGVDLSPDGQTLAVTQVNGTVDLVDARTLAIRGRLRAQRKAALGVEFSPDGRLLAVTGDGARVTLWDARTLAPVRELNGMKGFSQEVAFSPNGRLLAVGNQDGMRVRTFVWDVRTGERTRLELGVSGASLAFSPNGRLLAANGFEEPAEVLDVRTGRVVARLEPDNESRSVAFSPDGELLAIGGYGGAARLFSTRTWKRVGRAIDGQEGRITAVEFSPDGVLATVSADGSVLLWDVATQRAIGSPLQIEPDAYVAAAFSRDGSHLFVVPHTGRGVRWDVRPESWKRHACLVAGRELTEAEWRDALPDRPLRPVCRRR